MVLMERLNDLQIGTQLGGERTGGVAHHRQAAASLRTIDRERGDDRGASRFQHLSQAVTIRLSIGFFGQEMKDGPIVPDVGRPRVPDAGDVGLNPFHGVGNIGQAGSRARQRRA
jgi:hypothetical protein